MKLMMATKCTYTFEPDYAVPPWGTLEKFMHVGGQVARQEGQVTGQVGGRATGEFRVDSSYEAIQAGGHSRLPFQHGVRNLLTANPPSLCSTSSILAGLFLPGLAVSGLKGFFRSRDDRAFQGYGD